MGKIVLISGGAKSGKSSFSLKYCKRISKNPAFIATAIPFDEEMTTKISLHKKERSNEFFSIEEPLDLLGATKKAFNLNHKTILIDCLTLWVSNLLLNDYSESQIKERLDHLCDWVMKNDVTVVVVSNEVGFSVVPENKLARKFRDINGICQKHLAMISYEVIFVILGIPIKIKPKVEAIL